MPRLMIRCGARPAISWPSRRIEPPLGARAPDSMLKIVLLPEPLGPMSPRISPGSTANETLATAVKPPKRLVNPSTVSKSRRAPRSLRRVGRRARQRHHGFALLLALGPHQIRLVVDVLENDREGAIVLARHGLPFPLELDAETGHGAAFWQIDLERRLAERLGVDAAVFLDGAWQHLGHEHVGIAGRHADVCRLDHGAGPRLLILVTDHLDHCRQPGPKR